MDTTIVPDERPPALLNGKANPAYNKWYRAHNKAKLRELNHAYYVSNKAKHHAYSKAYKHAHPEKERAYRQRRAPEMRAYHVTHRPKANARNRERYHSDPAYKARRLVENRARVAQKLAAPVNDFTAEQWLTMQEAANHRCAYCGIRAEGELTEDHITPLSQGGSHTLWNIVPACRTCNPRKGTRGVLSPVQPLLL